MTYVEFFDKVSVENICACLTNVPEKVILIGNNTRLMTKYIGRYELIFTGRGSNIEFVCKSVNTKNLSDIICVLTEIVESETDCAFDLTGGDELMLTAMGVVYERYKDKGIQTHRFNVHNGTINDCDGDGITVMNESPVLTVEENIRLYGGDLVYCTDKPDTTYAWNCDSEFRDDISAMWKICRNDVRLWNTQIGVLEAAELFREESDEVLLTSADVGRVTGHLARKGAVFVFIKEILYALYDLGLITYLYYEDNMLSVVYKNEQVKRCLTKAGRILEMKIFAVAMDLKNDDGSWLYNDVVNGAFIDWDGDIHSYGVAYDTENEIDNILMKGLIPVFVSCKNGYITVDELYKLNTVAERFGGKYAKKVLVATALDKRGEFGDYYRQRAKDMNIRLVEDIQSMEDSQLSREVSLWWRS